MKYYVLKCEVISNDYQEESYGVLMVVSEGVRKYICNVTNDYHKICKLVEKMNEYPAEPSHAENIIEDFKYILTTGESTWLSGAFLKFGKKILKNSWQ